MGASPAPSRASGYAVILLYKLRFLTRAPSLGGQNMVSSPLSLPRKYCQQFYVELSSEAAAICSLCLIFCRRLKTMGC